MKKLTRFTGYAFLIWFLFSPIIAALIYSNTFGKNEDATIKSFYLLLVATYLILGVVSVYLIKYFGGPFVKTGDNVAEKRTNEWTVVLNYVVYTNILYAIFSFVSTQILFRLLPVSLLTYALSIVINVIFLWCAIKISVKSIKKYQITDRIITKSILWFIIANIAFTIFLKLIQNQTYLALSDIALLIYLIFIYIFTKKYLKPNI